MGTIASMFGLFQSPSALLHISLVCISFSLMHAFIKFKFSSVQFPLPPLFTKADFSNIWRLWQKINPGPQHILRATKFRRYGLCMGHGTMYGDRTPMCLSLLGYSAHEKSLVGWCSANVPRRTLFCFKWQQLWQDVMQVAVTDVISERQRCALLGYTTVRQRMYRVCSS